jgi:hypothetical protein
VHDFQTMRDVRLRIAPSEVDSLDRVVSFAIDVYTRNNPAPKKRDRQTIIEARDLVIELRLAFARDGKDPSVSR